MKTAQVIVLAIVIGVFATAAQAVIVNFNNIPISGSQEVPPNASQGTGIASMTLDTVTGDMTVSGSFSGLVGNVTVSHVHGYAPVGINAGVVFGLTIDAGVTSGNFSGAATIPSGNIADVLAGLTYINIHTTAFPGGEIRGQITPEPTSLALLGLGGAALLRRRRRAA